MRNQKIAVICAGWSQTIVKSGCDSFINTLTQKGFNPYGIDVFYVPGSLEIPLAGQKLLQRGYECAVGIGLIVDGGIYHHEFVAQTVVDGIMKVGLDLGKPFLSVAISPQKFREGHAEDEKWFVDHFVIKGREAANAAEQMLDFIADING